MLRISGINFKVVGLVLVFAILGGLICSDSTQAACADNDAPCIEVNFGTPQGGDLSVSPGLSYYDSTKFYLPVEIGLKNTNRYTVRVYGSGSSLTSGGQSIPTIGTDTSYEQLGQNGSEWGIRWNLGDTVEDKETNYHRVPSSGEDADSIVVENQYLPKSSTFVAKQLTLGFAVAVDANQPSGDYTNTITVAVVASPREARSFFDITTMQEMVPEICANTTTPDKTATTKFDTDASHPGDTSYVPQTTLIDTRNSRSYLVRKLADGNCWMSQNLSLRLVTNTALTDEDTDLTSKTSWTPTHNTQTTTGITWDDGKDHSYSGTSEWSYFWAGGTSFSSTGAAAQGGQVGYAQRGVYYNWYAAAAGGGSASNVNLADNSICPKGWTLPDGGVTAVNVTDGSIKSFYNLVQIYTGITGNISNATVNTLYASPMNFVPAGFYNYSSAPTEIGTRQLYLTNVAHTSNLTLFSATVYPGTAAISAYNGFSVRCVAH